MILSTLQISTTLTWGGGQRGAFALQIYIFPFCVKGFGEDCRLENIGEAAGLQWPEWLLMMMMIMMMMMITIFSNEHILPARRGISFVFSKSFGARDNALLFNIPACKGDFLI